MKFDDPLDYFRQSDKPHDKIFVQAIENIRLEVQKDLAEIKEELASLGIELKRLETLKN